VKRNAAPHRAPQIFSSSYKGTREKKKLATTAGKTRKCKSRELRAGPLAEIYRRRPFILDQRGGSGPIERRLCKETTSEGSPASKNKVPRGGEPGRMAVLHISEQCLTVPTIGAKSRARTRQLERPSKSRQSSKRTGSEIRKTQLPPKGEYRRG